MAERITKTITVRRDVSDVYNLWSNFENLPHFMRYIKSVTRAGDRLSHWVMEGPLGKEIEWDARTTAMDEDRRIAWHSIEGDIYTSGEVLFDETSPGETRLTVTMEYEPKGSLGNLGAKLFSDAESRLEEDLQNFREYAESGARVTTRRGASDVTDMGSSGMGI